MTALALSNGTIGFDIAQRAVSDLFDVQQQIGEAVLRALDPGKLQSDQKEGGDQQQRSNVEGVHRPHLSPLIALKVKEPRHAA